MRILGLDVGDRRVGVALSDPEGILASPLTVVEREGSNLEIEAVLKLVKKHEASCIVVGLPHSLDGRLGPQAKKALDFIKTLSERAPVRVVSWDERFSTIAAKRALTDAGRKRGKQRKRRDAAAAAIILQSYLDRVRLQAEE